MIATRAEQTRRSRAASRLAAALLTACAALAGQARASVTDVPTPWANFQNPDAAGYIQMVISGGVIESDFESSSPGDPTNGGANVTPASTDISSDVASCGTNPGCEPSSFFGYYDGGTRWDANNISTMNDDFVFFRMRVRGQPTNGSGGFDQFHWNVLLDVDQDGYKEYWIDLNGPFAGGGGGPDRLQILYNNDNTQDVVDPDASRVDTFIAAANEAASALTHTRAYQVSGSTDWYIESQVPILAFKNLMGQQVLFPDTPIGLAFSTSASNTNPLQKDWSRDLNGGVPYDPMDPITFSDPLPPSPTECDYFPSDDPTDGRFLVVASSQLETMSGETSNFLIGVPSGHTEFFVELFDGDSGSGMGGPTNWQSGHWDYKNGNTIYRLYADPMNDGSGTMLLGQLTSLGPNAPNQQITAAPAQMGDNAWYRFNIATSAEARAPSGNYFYRLEASLAPSGAGGFNAFKIRGGPTATLRVHRTFLFISSIQTLQDYNIIYPDDADNVPPVDGPNNGGRTFDGTWELFASVPAGATSFELWDGDFDHAGDTDDPNTIGVPAFNVDPMAQPEGAVPVGLPNDDFDPASYRHLPGAVAYAVFEPSGGGIPNLNPSGNAEWELFRVGAAGVPDADFNVATPTLEEGPWRILVAGVDINNLNAMYYAGAGLAACETGLVLATGTGGMAGMLVLPQGADPKLASQPLTLAGEAATGETIFRQVVPTPIDSGRSWFSFQNLPAGRYYISLEDSAFYPSLAHLRAGEERTDLVVTPRPRTKVGGAKEYPITRDPAAKAARR